MKIVRSSSCQNILLRATPTRSYEIKSEQHRTFPKQTHTKRAMNIKILQFVFDRQMNGMTDMYGTLFQDRMFNN